MSMWFLIPLAVFLQIQATHGLYFYVQKEHRCFYLDIPKETHIRAIYEAPDVTKEKQIRIATYGPDAHAKQSPPLSDQLAEVKGAVSMTTKEHGEHWICVRVDTSQYDVPDLKLKFSLKISIGTDSFDYLDIAKREHLDDLEINVMRLRDRMDRIQKRQDYNKLKDLKLHNTSENNNSKTMWISILEIGVLVISGYIQVRHLQSYFYKKKLV